MATVNFDEYKDIWVFAEQRQGKLMNVAFELLGEGHNLSRELGEGCKVCALLVGKDVGGLADECFAYGADKVYVIDDDILEVYTTDAYTKAITDAVLMYKPEIVLYGATHIGRDLAPRCAARLDVGLTADCTHLNVRVKNYIEYAEANTTLNTDSLDPEDPSKNLLMTRPAFGGNLMATIVCKNSRPQMSTVRPGVMDRLEKNPEAKGEVVNVKCDVKAEDIRTNVKDVVKAAKELVNLTDADIIVSGGRGVKDAEGFKVIRDLADKVGGVVGASRAAVDSGWIDASHQVGQTGTTVKPKIYIACGISGAIQHQAGMQTSDIIIAINKDADCPMMHLADYALEGDLFKVIPELINEWN